MLVFGISRSVVSSPPRYILFKLHFMYYFSTYTFRSIYTVFLKDELTDYHFLLQSCQFMKNFTETALHVYFDGNLRIYNCDACCSRWYFTFSGAECSSPGSIDGAFYMAKGAGKNLHRHRHIEGHCNNIHKGKVRVGFWVGNCNGRKLADAYTGWTTMSRIFIEEVSRAQQ